MKITASTAVLTATIKFSRAQLNAEEIDKEMAAIAKTGLQEILILTGESRSKVRCEIYW